MSDKDNSRDRGQEIAGFERMTELGAFSAWSGVAPTGGFVLWLVSNDGGPVDWSKVTSRASKFKDVETDCTRQVPLHVDLYGY